MISSNIVSYLKGLITLKEAATCTAIARIQRGTSHDSLTRLLQKSKLDWQTLWSSLILKIVGRLSNGYLMIDDTVIDKTFAKAIDCIAWVHCSKQKQSILGLSVVVLCWSNGHFTIPLGLRIWQKDSGQTKIDLALELIRFAKRLSKK